MSTIAQTIIQSLDRNYPLTEVKEVKPVSDLGLGSKFQTIYQYIFGVTAVEFSGGYEYYKRRIETDMVGLKVPGALFFHAWPFGAGEADQLWSVLTSLAEHYNACLDINKMLEQAGVGTDQATGDFLLVVCVNQIRIPVPM
ncbi:hypothetical protein DCC81_03875 [Chitinophaga parva]|uniref:Uncharacterized protein n=1 Tax=Chitinophaga parva TaxID=2169414 RepID=A0A2T7BLT6_9BACT|nr:hypothetical protein [Chitinophaga parva]PUZ28632.1 hypothetical protein DCC81_03875 [Chitinophaga parva]